MIQGSIKFFPQFVYRSICIGVALEIRYILGLGPFVRQQLYLLIQIGHDMSRAGGHVAGTTGGTEQTAACPFAAITVRTCEAAIQRQFDDLFAEPFFQICVYGIYPQLLTVGSVEDQGLAVLIHGSLPFPIFRDIYIFNDLII